LPFCGRILKFTVHGTFFGLINFKLAFTAAGSSSMLPVSGCAFCTAATGAPSLNAAPAVMLALAPAFADAPGRAPFFAATPVLSPTLGSGADSSGSCAISVPKLNTLSFSPKLQLTGWKGSRWGNTTCSSKMEARLLESIPAATGRQWKKQPQWWCVQFEQTSQGQPNDECNNLL
jgi:hypothetical protein